MNLKFAAIGSSLLVAEEIKRAVKAIFYNDINIDACTLEDFPEEPDADLYICATTQLERLAERVPAGKIVCLELMPSSKFFLAVGRIPAGEKVYIWNNHRRYADILERYCQKLGIGAITFRPLPYDDLPAATVLGELRQARYLIGVDCFIDGDLLGQPEYRQALPEDAVLIKAERVASIHSAGQLLWMIAGRMKQAIAERRVLFAGGERTGEINEVLLYAEQAVELIRDSVNKAVCNQIAPDAQPAEAAAGRARNQPVCSGTREENLRTIDELQVVLGNLQAKLNLLRAGE